MANIQNATIEDVAPLDRTLARMFISCEIEWTADELSTRAEHNMEIFLWADDGLDGPSLTDERIRADLFNPNGFLENPVVPTERIQRVVFEPTVRSSLLNEDNRVFNNRDEIYARLRLSRDGETVATSRTNVYKDYFV